MPTVTCTRTVDADGLAALRRPRTDVVTEIQDGPDAWEAAEGPFRHYRRTLIVDGGTVIERTEFALATLVWSPLIGLLMRRALADLDRRPRARIWWPREVVTRRTATLVSVLAVVSVMTGYLGVIIGQTITFAAEDFGAGDSAQANTLAAVRVGVLIPLVLLRRADRVGRRPLVLGFITTAIVFTTAGALAEGLVVLGGFQTIARGLTTGLVTLLVLAVTEEVPAGARAFSISLITIAAALGAGMVVWVLPVADLVEGGWRVVYLVPLAFLPVVWWVGRHLPETRRFDAAVDHDAPAPIGLGRFALLAVAAFASALFLSPASQLRNEYLRDEQGFSAAAVSAFQLLVSAPAGVAVVAAGILADRIGRRWVGSLGLGIGVSFLALSFRSTGVELWMTASAGVVLTGMAFPATRGFQTELFPTRARARVGAWLDVVGVAGSAVGLIVVGRLSEQWDDLGSAIGIMVVAPLAVAVLIATRFPETSGAELESFNPGDPRLSDEVTARTR
jgi:MFS family permease